MVEKNEDKMFRMSEHVLSNMIRGVTLKILIPCQLIEPAFLMLSREKAPAMLT